MRWIKDRNSFLNEAKIKDLILPKQKKEVVSRWGEKYLDYEEVEPTDKIEQGRWKLSKEDKIEVLSVFFGAKMDELFKIFENLPDRFVNTLERSINIDLIRDKREKYEVLLKDFNAKEPTIDQISILFDPIFRKLSVAETVADEMIQKDENGRPIRDDEGVMIKVKKKVGDPIFEKNLVNINSFIEVYNRCYPQETIDDNTFNNRNLTSVVNIAKENHNPDYKIDFEVFNRDIYLSIQHDPKQILNMSISTFFSSCQHLYTGSYRSQLLGNIFDPNSIPAFLVFDTPIFWDNEKISDNLPLSRMIIRNIETFGNDEKKIFFDRCYPDRMHAIVSNMVEKYTSNESTTTGGETYIFAPDMDIADHDNISTPYMDRLGLNSVKYIGVNTKSLYLNRGFSWSDVKISPKANIKELVIETESLPKNFSDIKLNPDWVKFKYIKINNLSNFDKVKTDSVAFDKCKFQSNVIDDIIEFNSDMKKLQFISCDISGTLDLAKLEKLEELHLIYTIDDIDDLRSIIDGLNNLKKLVISGDLLSDSETKKYISELRRNKLKVEILGPVI
jgi:hypothetical protein